MIEAKLTRVTEMFSKMDPYVIIKMNDGCEYKTKTVVKGGKFPKWNETIDIMV